MIRKSAPGGGGVVGGEAAGKIVSLAPPLPKSIACSHSSNGFHQVSNAKRLELGFPDDWIILHNGGRRYKVIDSSGRVHASLRVAREALGVRNRTVVFMSDESRQPSSGEIIENSCSSSDGEGARQKRKRRIWTDDAEEFLPADQEVRETQQNSEV